MKKSNHKSTKVKMNLFHLRFLSTLLLLVLFSISAAGQNIPEKVAGIPINYDETKVAPYTLPDPLVLQNGKKVKDPKTWHNKRRQEILSLFESEQFGKSPDRNNISFKVFETGTSVFGNVLAHAVKNEKKRTAENKTQNIDQSSYKFPHHPLNSRLLDIKQISSP